MVDWAAAGATAGKEYVNFKVSQRQRENMTFGTALPTEPPSGTAACPMGRVRLGVFFDGTDNNAWRDWGKGFTEWKPGDGAAGSVDKLRDDETKKIKYEDLNGPTNVAKLYYLFKEKGCCQKRIYSAGVGGGDRKTLPGTMHTVEGATGLGGRARIDWGIAWVTEFVNQNNHHLAIEKRIDTFGFSRGATQSRDFLNKVRDKRIENKHLPPTGHYWEVVNPPSSNPRYPQEPQYVKVNTYPEMRGILFEYLGIMDTVASEGVGSVFAWGNTVAGYNLAVLGRPKDDDKTPAEVLAEESTPSNVQEKEGWAHRTLHQVADDEFRDVFALEVIGNDPKKNGWFTKYQHLPKNMREASYPGCHADIGGAYRNSGEMFMNISNLTLVDMVKDARKGGVPFNDANTLPTGLHEVDPPGNVPRLSTLYANYCSLRAELIKKYAKDLPQWADWTHDIIHDPVYIQSYPDEIYVKIREELHASPVYQKLLKHYVHQSALVETYRDTVNPLRRHIRGALGLDRDEKYVKWEPVGEGRLTRWIKKPVKNEETIRDTLRQRDVHYHGFQNSYDHKNCPNK